MARACVLELDASFAVTAICLLGVRHGNWDHEYHKVKRETDAELERAHPKVESPRQGIRYGRRRLPSHIRPNHNGGVI